MKKWLIYLLVFIGFLGIGLLLFGYQNKKQGNERPKGAEDFNVFYEKKVLQ